ncbi:MAG: hypothetical protein ACTSPY_17695 [Candidatus Helarchaeota archaeon]
MVVFNNWIPRDGDVILTDDNFIMYAFGYDHLQGDKIICYIKYIPEDYINLFGIPFLEHKWNFRDIVMRRPKQLYSPKNFKILTQVFRKSFPDYLFYSKYLHKEIFVVPYSKIKEIFIPDRQLKKLLLKKDLDSHETQAVELIKLLSSASKVPIESFGIHGSTSYEMHTNQSDIDIAIYGRNNFIKVKQAMTELIQDNIVFPAIKIPTDKYRLNRGVYKNRDFVFNAIRNLDEIKNEYGKYVYRHKWAIKFKCQIIDDMESIFRPAKYIIKNVKTEKNIENSILNKIKEVVSMIGEFRGIGNKGDTLYGIGMLEEVKDIITSEVYYRIIIGSGIRHEFLNVKQLN